MRVNLIKRSIWFLITIAFVMGFSLPTQAAEEEYDFRKVRWGMTKEEVKKSELAEMQPREKGSSPNFISYIIVFQGKKFDLIYEFKDEKLFSIGLILREGYLNKNKNIKLFFKIMEHFKSKHGKEAWSNTLWKENTPDELKKDIYQYGYAVQMKYLKYIAFWKLKRKSIQLELYGEDGDVTLFIKYFKKV